MEPFTVIGRILAATVVAAGLFAVAARGSARASAQSLPCNYGTHQCGQLCCAGGTPLPTPTPSCTAPNCSDGGTCWSNGAYTGHSCAQGGVYCWNGAFICR
jgi:hypothetical protein